MPKPCPHKHLKKQMSGQQVWYVCECGQKFNAQLWDGKVRVVSPAGTGQPDGAPEIISESMVRLIMPRKNKSVKNILVHEMHKFSTWDELIALAEKHVLLARIREEELTNAIRLYRKQRDAGIAFPQLSGQRGGRQHSV